MQQLSFTDLPVELTPTEGESKRQSNLAALRVAALASSVREEVQPSAPVPLSETPPEIRRRSRSPLRYGLLLAILSLTALNLQRHDLFGSSPESRQLLRTTLQEELTNQARDIDSFTREEGHLPYFLSELPSLPYGEGWNYVRLSSDHYHLSLYQDGEFVVFDSHLGFVDPVQSGSGHQENAK